MVHRALTSVQLGIWTPITTTVPTGENQLVALYSPFHAESALKGQTEKWEVGKKRKIEKGSEIRLLPIFTKFRVRIIIFILHKTSIFYWLAPNACIFRAEIQTELAAKWTAGPPYQPIKFQYFATYVFRWKTTVLLQLHCVLETLHLYYWLTDTNENFFYS